MTGISPTVIHSYFSEGFKPSTRLYVLTIINHIIEGSLEAKLPTIWTVETQSREEAERRETIRRKKR